MSKNNKATKTAVIWFVGAIICLVSLMVGMELGHKHKVSENTESTSQANTSDN